jgi:hypothetical protein
MYWQEQAADLRAGGPGCRSHNGFILRRSACLWETFQHFAATGKAGDRIAARAFERVFGPIFRESPDR